MLRRPNAGPIHEMGSGARDNSWRWALPVGVALVAALAVAPPAMAQTAAQLARATIAAAEGRGVVTAADLATIRAGARRGDIETARAAIRALGRLERPAVIPDLMITLRSILPEVRVESAIALGQAAQGLVGLTGKATAGAPSVASVLSALDSRLGVDTDPPVRAALCEAIGRLPYRSPEAAADGETALVDFSLRASDVSDRLGLAKGLEALVRQNPGRMPGRRAIALLQRLAGGEAEGEVGTNAAVAIDPLRDARVRRLALAALGAAGEIGGELLDRAIADPDAQVRRLAVRFAAQQSASDRDRADRLLVLGRADRASMVRIEAVRAMAMPAPLDAERCASLGRAASDEAAEVSAVALDALDACGFHDESVALLERVASDSPTLGDPRAGQRVAYALSTLARVAPARAAAIIERFAASPMADRRDAAVRARRVLTGAGSAVPAPTDADRDAAAVTAMDLRGLGLPRARVTVRGVGRFDVQLFTAEAPRTVLAFVRSAEAGAFTGAAWGRVTANGFIEGPALPLPLPPTAPASKTPARAIPEVSAWPHVHGALGVLAGDRDQGTGRLFLDLVDNPEFDHEHAVFGQVLNGLDVVDRLLEGDVIERIDILP